MFILQGFVEDQICVVARWVCSMECILKPNGLQPKELFNLKAWGWLFFEILL